MTRIGIDVGGTKIEGIALGDAGREVARHRVPTPTAYDQVLAALTALVTRLEADAAKAHPAKAHPAKADPAKAGAPGRATVGVGTPGVLSPSRGVILNSNLLALNGRPLDQDLAVALDRPVRLANDAKCFVLSEAIDGAGAPPPGGVNPGRPDVVFGATLGTGVGGGMAIDGRVLTGENGAATEWSHTTLPFPRPGEQSPYTCVCGHPGCIESFTSGRALAARYAAQGGAAQDSLVDGFEVGRRQAAGDPVAGRVFDWYEDNLARALAMVINLVDPRVIVLGGGVSNNARIFANVPRLWEQYTVPKDLTTKLVAAAHGDASGVRGAALLWPPSRDGD